MKILQIEPKDIYVVMEFPLQELESLALALDHSEVKWDKNVPEEKESAENITKFYKMITDVIKDVKNGP